MEHRRAGVNGVNGAAQRTDHLGLKVSGAAVMENRMLILEWRGRGSVLMEAHY